MFLYNSAWQEPASRWVKFVFSRVFSEMCKRGLLRHNFQCKRRNPVGEVACAFFLLSDIVTGNASGDHFLLRDKVSAACGRLLLGDVIAGDAVCSIFLPRSVTAIDVASSCPLLSHISVADKVCCFVSLCNSRSFCMRLYRTEGYTCSR